MFFYIKTLGCKLNQAESEEAKKTLIEFGHEETSTAKNAHLIVLNTCTVTHIADRKSRQMLRKISKDNNSADIIVTGCAIENKLSNIPDIGTIIPKNEFIPYLAKYKEINVKNNIYTSQIRKNIIIQKGCNFFCSYCIIPFVRNELVSVPLEDILEQIKTSVNSGVKEIILTGINLGLYSYKGISLDNLLEEIVSLPFDFRIRLSSIEPNLVTDKLLTFIDSQSKICPHLHLPLQGSSDNLLHLMNRKYSFDDYLTLLAKINFLNRKIAITTDVIVGFPGETEEDFQFLLNLLEKLIFLDVHLFSYSKRDKTKAYSFLNHVPENIKKQRMQIAQKKLHFCRQKYLESLLNKECICLIEKIEGTLGYGYSEKYVPCLISNVSSKEFYQGKYHKIINQNNDYRVEINI
jgi:threonylcarbamoyladenosine tRNA methylthiotransferase MtaB